MQAEKLNTLDGFMLSNAGVNILNGSYWGFCSIEDYNKLVTMLNPSELENVKFHVLKSNSGVLIKSNSQYLVSLIDGLDGLVLSHEDIQEIDTLTMLGLLSFDMFLDQNDEYEGFVGVNEITDSTTVTISQKVYPSFTIDIESFMNKLSNRNMYYFNHENKWVKFGRGISESEFSKSFTMSPTRNCMVLPIKLVRE